MDENRLHCFLDAELAPGYIGWVIPGIDITQVGLGWRVAYRASRVLTLLSKKFQRCLILAVRAGSIIAAV